MFFVIPECTISDLFLDCIFVSGTDCWPGNAALVQLCAGASRLINKKQHHKTKQKCSNETNLELSMQFNTKGIGVWFPMGFEFTGNSNYPYSASSFSVLRMTIWHTQGHTEFAAVLSLKLCSKRGHFTWMKKRLPSLSQWWLKQKPTWKASSMLIAKETYVELSTQKAKQMNLKAFFEKQFWLSNIIRSIRLSCVVNSLKLLSAQQRTII